MLLSPLPQLLEPVHNLSEIPFIYSHILATVSLFSRPGQNCYIPLCYLSFQKWDLHLMCIAATKDLLDVGRNLVIVALVGAHLHIRIFDASGKKVVDKAESELISGEILTALKKRLNPFPDEFSLSKEDKQEIIRNATSIAGHTPSYSPLPADHPKQRMQRSRL